MKWSGKSKTKLLRLSLVFGLTFLGVTASYADCPALLRPYEMPEYDVQLDDIFKYVLAHEHDLSSRINKASALFLRKKYLLGALGEGSGATFDKSPLYRTDAFDCVTYISTVLALTESHNKKEFLDNFKKIQYKDGRVSFYNRHHFIETDWNTACQRYGLIKDITPVLSPHYKIACALIDKPNWYRHLSMGSIKCFLPGESGANQKLLWALHRHADQIKPNLARTNYLPLSELIKYKQGKLCINQAILDRVPSGAIVELVDKTQNFKKKIGTEISIVHLGFAIRQNQLLLFRHASKVHNEVVDVLFEQYLKRWYVMTTDPRRVGIHVEQILSREDALLPGAT